MSDSASKSSHRFSPPLTVSESQEASNGLRGRDQTKQQPCLDLFNPTPVCFPRKSGLFGEVWMSNQTKNMDSISVSVGLNLTLVRFEFICERQADQRLFQKQEVDYKRMALWVNMTTANT